MVCPNCGNNLPDNSVACNMCGMMFYRQNNNQINNKYRKEKKIKGSTIFIIVATLLVFGAIGSYLDKEKEKNENATYSNEISTESNYSTEKTENKLDLSTEAVKETDNIIPFESTVIYSDDDLDVTITSYEEMDGVPELGLKIDNHSKEDYRIDEFITTVNRTMVDGIIFDTPVIASGKILYTSINIRGSKMELCGFDKIYTVAIQMSLSSDSKTVKSEDCTFRIRDGEYRFSDELIYDDNYISVYRAESSSDLKSNTIRVYNKTESPLFVEIVDISVNDIMFQCYPQDSGGYGIYVTTGASTVYSENSIFMNIELMEDELVEKDISTINKIEFKINNTKDYSDHYSDPIILE